MENSFQTSFIPKRPIAAPSAKANRPPTSIFTILAFLLLILMGAASGGLFLYKNYLIKQKEVLSESLAKVRNTFEQDTIDELELYDKRVAASEKILGSHIVLSPMFTLLGSLTIPSIQYTKFEHQTNASGFVVKMSGVAIDYKSIALQADVFNSAKGRYFKNVVFSNLAKDKTNNITFDLEFNVDPALLSYEKNMALEQIQAKTESAPPVQQPEVTPTIPNPGVPSVEDAISPSSQGALTPQPGGAPVDNETQ